MLAAMESKEVPVSRLVAPCATVLLLAAGAAAQTTWTVDRLNRPGTDFLDLQPAVDAAASGDILRIRAAGAPSQIWTTPSYTAPIIDGKSLTVFGEGADGATVTWMRGVFQVRNLQPGQVVRLADFVVWETSFVLSGPGAGMRLENNQGTVLLERLRLEPIITPVQSGALDCKLVVMNGVHVVAQPVGLGATRCNIVMQDCLCEHRDTGNLRGPAFASLDSRVWMHHTTILGGDYNITNPVTFAVGAYGSEVFLGPGTFLRGGAGQAARWPALYVEPTQDGRISDVHVDPGVTWIGSLDGNLDFAPVTSLRPTTTATTLAIDHSCTPGGLVLLTAGPLLPTPLQPPEGMVAIQPLPDFVCTVFAPPTGLVQWNFALPPGLPADFILGMQGAELRPDGTVRITDPMTVCGR